MSRSGSVKSASRSRKGPDWLDRAIEADCPEVALFPTLEDRRKLLRDAQRALFARNWRFYAYVVATALVTGLLVARGFPFLLRYTRWLVPDQLMRFVALPLVLVGIYYAGLALFWRASLRRFVRRRLVELGVPVCQKCGYDCRGQREPRCPECGARFDPALLRSAGDLPPSNCER